MLDAGELAELLLRGGPQPAGVIGGETDLMPAPALSHAADDLAREWSARLAIAQTMPPQAAARETTLVLSLRDVFVLAERVVADVRHRTLLHAEHLSAFLLATVTAAATSPAPAALLPDVVLDPAQVAVGSWPPELQAVVETAHLVLEAVLATAYETARELRPMVTMLLGDQGVVCLDARPAQRALTFRQRDAAGAAQLLADLLQQG